MPTRRPSPYPSSFSRCPFLYELTDGFAVLPSAVTAIRRSLLDDSTCTLYVAGQSALAGFTVDRPFDEVLEDLNDALEEEFGGEAGEAGDEEEDDWDAAAAPEGADITHNFPDDNDEEGTTAVGAY